MFAGGKDRSRKMRIIGADFGRGQIPRPTYIRYKCKNYGRTPAFITRFVVHFRRYTNLDLLPIGPQMVLPSEIPVLPEAGIPVPPGESTPEQTVELAENAILSDEEIVAVQNRNLFLYASVFVRYKDLHA